MRIRKEKKTRRSVAIFSQMLDIPDWNAWIVRLRKKWKDEWNKRIMRNRNYKKCLKFSFLTSLYIIIKKVSLNLKIRNPNRKDLFFFSFSLSPFLFSNKKSSNNKSCFFIKDIHHIISKSREVNIYTNEERKSVEEE